MEIDLTLLHSGTIEQINITNLYTIPKEYFSTNQVLEINNIKVEGKIYQAASDDDEEKFQDYIQYKIKGDIILEDSISLEPVNYPISIEYDDILEENYKKNENTLDIFQFLWMETNK